MDNPHNLAELERLSSKSRKFRSNINFKKISPDSEFYQIFSPEQIIEIVNDLEIHSSIEHKFTYLSEGSGFWNDFYVKNVPTELYPTPKRVETLLEKTFEYILYQLRDFEKINIIDIGSGNAIPVKNLLQKLDNLKILNKYTSLDISAKMNELALQNIQEWFPNLEVASVVADVELANLAPVFFENKISDENSVNLILYLGGTIGNHRNMNHALANIKKGLGKNDLLIISNGLDTNKFQSQFAYFETTELKIQNSWIPKMLGFNVSKCKIVTQFEGVGIGKTEKMELDKDYSLEIKIKDKIYKLEFIKGQKITLWRHKMSNLDTLPMDFKSCGLQICQMTALKDFSNVMIFCRSV